MSSDNKFALLASLTASSLPPTGDSSNQILSSNEGSQNNSDSEDNDNGEVVFMQDPVDDKKKAADLLSASGLLTGSGGGLFDEVDKEEEERERARLAELERKEQEELRAKQEAEAQRQLQLEQKQAQEAREAMEREMRQEQLRQQQIQQENINNLQPNLNTHNGVGVNMGMQNLSLQDPQQQLGTNIGMPHQAPTYSNASPMDPNGATQTHSTMLQSGANQTYSNASPMVQNGMNQITQQIQQPQPPIQQAGFGGSYYYSTSGNVQQKFNSPTMNPSVGASMASPNTTSFTLSPGVNRHDNSKLLGPDTKGSVPPHTNSVTSTTSSYAVRSQMRHVNSPPRTNMPAGLPPPIPNINGQESAPSQNPPVPADIPKNVTSIQQYDPSTFKPTHGVITISDPILVQSPGVFSGPPYWTYAVTVRDVNVVEGQEEFSKVVSSVRRRFRHFVALEERLRADRPGSILPPRYVLVDI